MPAVSSGDEAWRRFHSRQKLLNIGHTDGESKGREEWLIVRRVSKESVAIKIVFEFLAESILQKTLTPLCLVKVSKPTVHMDRRHFAGGPNLLKAVNNLVDGTVGESGDVLTEVDREIQFSVGLIGSQSSSWNGTQDRRCCCARWWIGENDAEVARQT